MARGALVVLITTPRDKAREIARRLVEERLAACVNVVDEVHRIYWWQGKVEEDKESLLIVKTRVDAVQALIEAVRRIHPYQVPEVIALPIIAGLEDYLKWLEDEVRPGGTGEPKADRGEG